MPQCVLLYIVAQSCSFFGPPYRRFLLVDPTIRGLFDSGFLLLLPESGIIGAYMQILRDGNIFSKPEIDVLVRMISSLFHLSASKTVLL